MILWAALKLYLALTASARREVSPEKEAQAAKAGMRRLRPTVESLCREAASSLDAEVRERTIPFLLFLSIFFSPFVLYPSFSLPSSFLFRRDAKGLLENVCKTLAAQRPRGLRFVAGRFFLVRGPPLESASRRPSSRPRKRATDGREKLHQDEESSPLAGTNVCSCRSVPCVCARSSSPPRLWIWTNLS